MSTRKTRAHLGIGLATLGVAMGAAGGCETHDGQADADVDPYVWLENVEGERALAWVQEQNARSAAALTGTAEFEALRGRLLAAADSEERIPLVAKRGEHVYNFWRDRTHERGLWRRTRFEAYTTSDDPPWEPLLDVDALAESEGVPWSWAGVDCLPPQHRLCLVKLSRGGSDATVIREFDLAEKRFVPAGFSLPESKGQASWYDEDTLLVSRDFGPDTLTDSGYPRTVRLWKRGQPLEEAQTIFEGQRTDVLVSAHRDLDAGFERTFYHRRPSFFTRELYYAGTDARVRIETPDDAEAWVHREWLYVTLRSAWSTGSRTYPAGALLALRFDAFLAGERDFQILFDPGPRKSLGGVALTRSHVLIRELEEVQSRLYRLQEREGRWQRKAVGGLPEHVSVSVRAVDDETSDDYWLTLDGFLTPDQLWLQSGEPEEPRLLRELPGFFQTDGLVAEQYHARSRDGTRIPYFVVRSRTLAPQGQNPTLLYGYGGFQNALTPSYNPDVGMAWLERGGVYAVANIRGGGEFGPAWHQAALRENRERAYEDFIAVAEDLIARGITQPRRLGIRGGSNGGLLVGNVLTRRPDLFGAVVCQAPLLDMKRYTQLPAGASWIEEYGDPDVPEQWAYLRRYSPYHQVDPDAAYPPVLLTTSTRDDRVHPGHARKMAARLEEAGAPVLFYENVEGGHSGSSTNEQRAHLSAQIYTFLWKNLGD